MAIIAVGFSFVGCDNDVGKQTPVVGDFNISGIGTFDYDGTAKTVTITPKPNKSTGEITVYYNGSVTAPIPINTYSTYSVTFNIAESEGFNEANGLLAGSITINPVPVDKTYPITATTRNGNTVNITIHYTALPAETPGYIQVIEDTLKLAFGVRIGASFVNDLAIRVINTGTDGFAKTESKTLSVSESWLEDHQNVDDIYDAIADMIDLWAMAEYNM
jgi:hypothetical protein